MNISQSVGAPSSEAVAHGHTHNPTAALQALAALDGPRFDVWSWDHQGNDLAGTVTGTRWMPDKFGKPGDRVPALELELIEDQGRVLVYLGSGLRRQVEVRNPHIGEGIAIRRGEMVERAPLPPYREWIVEVVPAGRPEIEIKGGPALPGALVDP